MKSVLLSLFFPLILLAQSQAQLPIGEAAYLVGRQQVLVQQIARAYLAIELKLEVQSYRTLMSDGIKLFDSHLEKLETFNAGPEVKKAIDGLTEAWDEFSRELSDAPKKEEVLELVKLSRELLLQADKVLIAMEIQAENSAEMGVDKTALHLLHLSQYQNALSQHAILYYLAYWNNASVDDFFPKLNKTILEYEDNFRELIASTENNEELNAKIMANAYEWRSTAKLITNVRSALKKDDLRKVLSSADLLFRDANLIAKSYKALVDAGVAKSGE